MLSVGDCHYEIGEYTAVYSHAVSIFIHKTNAPVGYVCMLSYRETYKHRCLKSDKRLSKILTTEQMKKNTNTVTYYMLLTWDNGEISA